MPTLGYLFTIDDSGNLETSISKIECGSVPFEVNKSVTITYWVQDVSICEHKEKDPHLIKFRDPMWEIKLANFLEVDNGSRVFKLDGLSINVNAWGVIEADSLYKLTVHIRTQFKTMKKNEL
jgi:hypothetical protein